MNKIRLIADRETCFVYHMLSVSRCGYDNAYGARWRDGYPAEDLAVLKRHEDLLTCSGGAHWGGLYTLMLCMPARGMGSAKEFYREIIRQADIGDVPEHYLPLKDAAREIAAVMIRCYDHYVRDVWPEELREIESHIALVTPLFESSAFTDRAEEAVGCALQTEYFCAAMVASVQGGAEAIDISPDRDVFGITRSPQDSFRFIAHEFIIYLLKHALRDLDAFRRFETWRLTEGLAEFYLKKLLGSAFFAGQEEILEFCQDRERAGAASAADLYAAALAEFIHPFNQ